MNVRKGMEKLHSIASKITVIIIDNLCIVLFSGLHTPTALTYIYIKIAHSTHKHEDRLI